MSNIDQLLNDLYYAPGKFTNTKELFRLAQEKNPKIKYEQVNSWLNKQQIHQLTKKNIKDKRTHHGHFYVTKPNQLHQMDILYMPYKRGTYRYILTIIDTASRYKAGEPLKDRTSETVKKAIEKIYKETKLKFPKEINVDKGSEFKAAVLNLFKNNNTQVNVSETSYHKATAMVERVNRTLAERIFKQINHEEISTHKVIRVWDHLLQPTIDQLNNEITRYINMTPNQAIELSEVPQKEHKDFIPINNSEYEISDKVRYKLAKDAIHDISLSYFDGDEITDLVAKHGKKRATDPTYSLTIHTIERIKENPGLQNIYYLDNIKHGFAESNLIKV
jgi:hypothetical protein